MVSPKEVSAGQLVVFPTNTAYREMVHLTASRLRRVADSVILPIAVRY